MSNEDVAASLGAEAANAGVNWQFQIGPAVSGGGEGTLYTGSAVLLLSLGQGDPGATYAEYSFTGSNWTRLVNNQVTPVSGSNYLQYRYFAPPGVSWKLVFGSR